MTVKGIKKRTLPELNDEFAKELGNYESLDDLEARVREHLASRKRRSVEAETKDRLFAALVEKYPVPGSGKSWCKTRLTPGWNGDCAPLQPRE